MSSLKIYIALIIIIASLIGITMSLSSELAKEKAEKDLYQRSANVLLDAMQTYKAKDSLNVASIGMIELNLSEYKKYRAEDVKLISSLKVDKNRLEQITTTQTQTIYQLKGTVRDSIVHRDNYIVDTLRCISIRDKWFDLQGCSNKLNEFLGRIEYRDSLTIVNHVKQKRFLGFLWYYGKKDNRVDVVSKNPNTKITGVEYIQIRD